MQHLPSRTQPTNERIWESKPPRFLLGREYTNDWQVQATRHAGTTRKARIAVRGLVPLHSDETQFRTHRITRRIMHSERGTLPPEPKNIGSHTETTPAVQCAATKGVRSAVHHLRTRIHQLSPVSTIFTWQDDMPIMLHSQITSKKYPNGIQPLALRPAMTYTRLA